jgi:PAS domain S-box-containing protein
MPAAFDPSSGDVTARKAADPGGSSDAGTGAAGDVAMTGAGPGALLDLIRIATFVLDPDGRIAVWSPAAVDLTGRPVVELLGAPVGDLFAAPARARAEALFRRAAAGRSGWVGFLPVRHGDGRVFDVGFRAVALRYPGGRDLVQVVATDAGDLRRVEFERALFEALFRQIPAGIAIYDTERRFVRVNRALTAYNGFTAEEHLGRRVEELMPDIDPSVPRMQQRVLETGEPVVDMVVKAATRSAGPGSRHYSSVSYARLESPDGAVLGLTGVIEDVTERQSALERSRLARRRAAVLNAASIRIGTSLDFDRTGNELADVAVPMFCDAATVYLLDSVAGPGAQPSSAPPAVALAGDGTADPDAVEPILLHAVANRGRVEEELSPTVGQVGAPYPPIEPGSALYEGLTSGRARFYRPRQLERTRRNDRCIVAPLVARGALIGAVRFERSGEREEFAPLDLETADELAARAAVSMDNARLYVRERDTALLLQRSLLPEHFPAVDGTQIAFRYRPGSVDAQVGGDWFDVIALPCRRVALVLGDVMGSGLRAAGIMGQFRTAARTLARLDLSPALVLRELDELAQSMSESHIATCVYAVYDPVAGECVMASAGHLPPLLITPSGDVELVHLPPGAPLGVGGQRFEELEFSVEPASALALYTDGLVEDRTRDIDAGIDELLGAIAKAATGGPGAAAAEGRWLEAACDAAFDTLLDPHRVDDATLLIAALDGFPEDRVASWVLTSQPTVASRARELVRRRLVEWAAEDAAANADDSGLSPLAEDVADVVELLVSELVTNALRYGRGPIGLRLLRGAESVVCEVSDEFEAAPRLRTVHHGDEGGRGLYLVDQLSARWGTRNTPHGKIVWFEV